MALNLPSIDRITKENPKLGEALVKAQQYVNQNVALIAGNRLPKPPVDATNNTAR